MYTLLWMAIIQRGRLFEGGYYSWKYGIKTKYASAFCVFFFLQLIHFETFTNAFICQIFKEYNWNTVISDMISNLSRKRKSVASEGESSSAISTQTGKVTAYEIASNGYSTSTRYRNKCRKMSYWTMTVWIGMITQIIVKQIIRVSQIFILYLQERLK